MTKNNLLMVGNFSPDTGYAWGMINKHFISIGKYFIQEKRKAYACYPELTEIPKDFSEHGIETIKFDFDQATYRELVKFIKSKKIKTVYLIDKAAFSVNYFFLRLAGVKHIVVHDHTSGKRKHSGIAKKYLKLLLNRLWLFSADKVIAISDYVAKRQKNVSCVPEKKIITLYNGTEIIENFCDHSFNIFDIFQIPYRKKIIFCCGRANIYKGIHIFIRVADILLNKKKRTDLFFLYCGDGPDFENFRKMIKELKLEKNFSCPGQVDCIKNILPNTCACIVPSLWNEGFGLVVIEAMAAGIPVIASRVGGMAEIINDGVDGFYVNPGDSQQIANIVEMLVDNTKLGSKIGKLAKKKIETKYNIKNTQIELVKIFRDLEAG